MFKQSKCNIHYFFSLSCFIFIILQFIFIPKIEIDIKSTLPPDVSWRATYEYSNDELPSLSAYDIMTESGYLKSDGSFSLRKVPIIADTILLKFEVDDRAFNIAEVKCKIYNFPFKIFTGNSLDEIICLEENGDGTLYLHISNLYDLLKWSIILSFCFSIISGYYLLNAFSYIQKYIGILCLLITPMLAFITIETATNNIWFLGWKYRLINYIFYLIIFLLIHIIVHQIRYCTVIYSGLFLIISIINYYVLLFRGKPLLPWDIYAFSTAMNVASSYVFTIPAGILYCVLVNGLYNINLLCNKDIESKIKHKKRIGIICIVCSFLCGILLMNKEFAGDSLSCWDTDIVYYYRTKGSLFSFTKYWKDNRIQKPDGYSPEVWDKLENSLPQTKVEEDEVSPQYIIMVMNESLTDFGTIDNKETLPFLNSLSNSSIWGNLYVSVRGGSTCNTEFEILTGNSLALLPPNTFPFQSYINHSLPSIANILKGKGYSTAALHLEQGKNWNRNTVYPKLGFDIFYDINSYNNIDTIRGRATDQYNYKQLIDLVETSSTEKLFIFNTTIQNHGGYTDFKDLPQTFDLSSYGEFEEAEVYLSLIRLSDNAFEEMINYFSNIDEPTMIIMFGDHQPKLEEKSEEFLFENNLNNPLARYSTPFVIWKNYENKSQYISQISANYLPTLILEEANMDLPVFHRFLKKLYEEFPVITLQGIIDKNGKYYTSIDEIAENPLIKTYEMLQYSILFD